MPNQVGVYDTEGDFPGWAEMAVIRGEMRGFKVLAQVQGQVNEFYEEGLRDLVFGLRYRNSYWDEANGVTWAEIGEALGISRQAAQQRFSAWVDTHRDELIASDAQAQQQLGEDIE